MDIINLDHNASTRVLPEVWEAMRPFMLTEAGNPASSHALGRRARRALEDAREKTAELLDANPEEVLFTSGATEANNLAIFGLAGSPPGVLVSSAIEHPCVVEPLRELGRRGFTQISLPVSREGVVQPLTDGWPQGTRLLAVMLANHETGAFQPVAELAATAPEGAAFHCDAAAAVGKMPVSFCRLGVTTLTLSAHKFHGPKGIGALLLRKGARLAAQLFGGHQQRGLRPGTEPVALAVGLATALEYAVRHLETNHSHVGQLRARFIELLRETASPIVVNGPVDSLSYTANISFPGCKADALLMALDLAGIACSAGSACSSGSLLPSPVLAAMNVKTAVLRSAMRFSFSAETTLEEIILAANRISKSINRLRQKI